MKARYFLLIIIISILIGTILFFSVFNKIETNNDRGISFCKNNDMNFDIRRYGFSNVDFYCTKILDDAFIEKEIKLSGDNWGFA